MFDWIVDKLFCNEWFQYLLAIKTAWTIVITISFVIFYLSL